jgi:hypothetical protein
VMTCQDPSADRSTRDTRRDGEEKDSCPSINLAA